MARNSVRRNPPYQDAPSGKGIRNWYLEARPQSPTLFPRLSPSDTFLLFTSDSRPPHTFPSSALRFSSFSQSLQSESLFRPGVFTAIMPENKEFTFQEVASHNTKKDLYMVIHDKVYDVSSFVDEHPGGEEVLLDVAGQDSTEAFEDVGHSDEAREILAGLQVGTLKRQPGDPAPKAQASTSSSQSTSQSGGSTGLGIGLYAALLVGGALAYGAYQYLQTTAANKQGGKCKRRGVGSQVQSCEGQKRPSRVYQSRQIPLDLSRESWNNNDNRSGHIRKGSHAYDVTSQAMQEFMSLSFLSFGTLAGDIVGA
ncbi:hypothetical protein VTN00DRAFT_5008 [Thermoascus crustaceus]|uniref:uncharacterized protein n=1 Tax=Thermoascus crustaceus TaxID=5088 RepID=UPI003743071B